VCSTKDDDPQTFRGGSGTAKYFEKLAGTKLHGLYLASNDSAVATRQQDLLMAFPEHAGMKSDQHAYISATSPQSAYTPLVQKLKADNSNFAYSAMGSAAVIALRQEAQLQGLDNPKMLWICISCYDKTLPAADSAQGTYEPLGTLPFEEAKYNKNLAALVKLVGTGKLDQFSIYGFAATLLFKQALEDAVAKGGANAVTRADVLAAASRIGTFDAGGMIAPNNIAERKTGPCFLVLQVKNKKWTRAYPSKPGTFACDPKDVTLLQRPQDG
jgi:ABC-type branched-subunit amino acid transport system substrate-binding protein